MHSLKTPTIVCSIILAGICTTILTCYIMKNLDTGFLIRQPPPPPSQLRQPNRNQNPSPNRKRAPQEHSSSLKQDPNNHTHKDFVEDDESLYPVQTPNTSNCTSTASDSNFPMVKCKSRFCTTCSASPHKNSLVPQRTFQLRHCESKTNVIHVDSSLRNASFPSASKYVFKLPCPMKNVCSLALSFASFPRSEYTFTVENRYFDVCVDGTAYSIEFPLGRFTSGESLTSTIQETIDMVLGANKLIVELKSFENKLKFSVGSSATTVHLLWESGENFGRNAFQILGYGSCQDVKITIDNPSISPNSIVLNRIRSIYLYIDELRCTLNFEPFYIIPIDEDVTKAHTLFKGPIQKLDFPPISCLNQLTIYTSIKYHTFEKTCVGEGISEPCCVSKTFERAYDHHGLDHILQFEVEHKVYKNEMEDHVCLEI